MDKKPDTSCQTPLRDDFHLAFRFSYGKMDDGTIWIYPPSQNLFHVGELTLRVILEMNSGSHVDTVCRKYQISEEEVRSILARFQREKAIVQPKYGKIARKDRKDDISLTALMLVMLVLGIIQVDYFRYHAKTLLLDNWYDGALVGAVALAVIFFHELGHYLTAKKYLGIKPKYGFTFLFVFPAVYVDTHLAWTLPRNMRILINASGCIADLMVNTVLVVLAMSYPALEYFVTPLLITQYTRWSVVLNPLYKGDGYWLLADSLGVVNLMKKGWNNLFRLKLNLYSLFGLMALVMMSFSMMGLSWLLFNIFKGFILKFI
ncbi:MAG: hypothetical protein ABIH89_04575 [Elusimicrobiota bacterium]